MGIIAFATTYKVDDGYLGAELAVPSKALGRSPDIKFRLVKPLELYPDFMPDGIQDMRAGLRLAWGGRAILYVGNLSFSGSVSALKSPDFALTMTPLGSSGFSANGISAALPSYAGSKQALAAFASFSLGGNKRRILVQLSASEKKLYTSAVTVPLLSGKLSVTSTSLAGLYFLPSVLPTDADTWFAKDMPYDSGWYFAGAEELRIRSKRFRSQLMTGFFVSPFGKVNPWAKVRTICNLNVFSVDGGLYLGDSGIVSAGDNRIRSTVQAFVVPQLRLVLPRARASFVRLGLSLAADGRNTKGLAPVFLVDAKVRCGFELSTPVTRIRIYAGRYGVPLYGEAPDAASKAEEKYISDLEFLFRELPVPATFSVAFGGTAYPADGYFFGKADFSAAISVTPSRKTRDGLSFLVPDLSIKTEATFRKHVFDSCTTEAAASWAYRTGFVTLRGKIALKLKI